jgi:hypothetical protein
MGDRISMRCRFGYRYEMRYIDMFIYHIDMVILESIRDMG